MKLTIYQIKDLIVTNKKVGWVKSNGKMNVPDDLEKELQKAFDKGKVEYAEPFYEKEIMGTVVSTTTPQEDFKTFISVAIGPSLRWKYGVK